MLNINKQIVSETIRLISSDGSMIGVVALEVGMSLASEQDLDLVEISPNASPPVCKIMDFKKFKYEEKKKAAEMKKKQKTLEIKEIKIRPSIAANDLGIKIKNMTGFIQDGNHVKVSLMYKGREAMHKEHGIKIFHKILEDLKDIAKPESEPKFTGNTLNMKIVPINKS